MAQNRANSPAFINEQIYSAMILTNLHDGLLPELFYRNVTDFGSGSVLNIKTVGSVTVQDVAEDVAVDYTPIEAGTIQMTIKEHVGDAWYVTDELKEDGAQIGQLMTARSMESARALKEVHETRFLKAAAAPLITGATNPVNGFPRTLIGSGASNTIQIADFLAMKVAFDKANVPLGRRVAIVDPLTAATLAKQVTLQADITDFGREVLLNGFDRDHEYKWNIHGWHVITSNRLPRGAFGNGTTTVADGVANVFMSVADDNTKPVMHAWRRMPSIEQERNKDLRRQEFVTTCRYGFGIQRLDTLGVIITNATTY